MNLRFLLSLPILLISLPLHAGTSAAALKETADFILQRFGRGPAGETADQITASTAGAVNRHGQEAAPFLRQAGHAGFSALEQAGDKAPALLRLHARHGNEAVWLISDPQRLNLFLQHGDAAADAMLKHPGIAEALIARHGRDAARALPALSRQNAQRLSMLAEDGLLTKTAHSQELLTVVRQHGNAGLEFIWRNKGALAVAAVLTAFLADPKTYLDGAASLVAEPLTRSLAERVNWTLLLIGALSLACAPFLVRAMRKLRRPRHPSPAG